MSNVITEQIDINAASDAEFEAFIKARKEAAAAKRKQLERAKIMNRLDYEEMCIETDGLTPSFIDLGNKVIGFTNGDRLPLNVDGETFTIEGLTSQYMGEAAGLPKILPGHGFLGARPKYMDSWSPCPVKYGQLRIGITWFDCTLSEQGWRFTEKEPYFGE